MRGAIILAVLWLQLPLHGQVAPPVTGPPILGNIDACDTMPGLEGAGELADQPDSCCPATTEWGFGVSDLLPFSRSTDLALEHACIEPNCRRSWSLVGAYGYETYRSFPEFGWQSNGLYGGLNLGTQLGSISDRTGIGFQIGATFGLYDWKGNPYRPDPGRRTRQDFVSYGFFRRATKSSPWTMAITQDWMFADNATTFGVSLELSQIRGQVGWVMSASNEFGILGAFRAKNSSERGVSRGAPAGSAPDLVVSTQAMNHVSVYWHHKWSQNGANTIISIGIPEKSRANGDGSLGDFLATATVKVPFTSKVGFFGNIMYMNPTAQPGFEAGHEDTWSFTLGIEIFPGGDARTKTVAGERWMPLLPVANNGIFLQDAATRQR